MGDAILETTQSARKGLTVAEIAERIRQGGRPITNLQVTKSAWRLKSLGKLHSRGDKSDPKNFQYIHPDTLLWEDFGTQEGKTGNEGQGGAEEDDRPY